MVYPRKNLSENDSMAADEKDDGETGLLGIISPVLEGCSWNDTAATVRILPPFTTISIFFYDG
jgi:hypothetical protein